MRRNYRHNYDKQKIDTQSSVIEYNTCPRPISLFLVVWAMRQNNSSGIDMFPIEYGNSKKNTLFTYINIMVNCT